MHKLFVAGTIALAAATAAYGQSGGSSVSRNYPVGAFDRIGVAGPYHVEVRTGTGPSVSASGPQQMMDRMVVEVRDGELKIHPLRDNENFHWNDRGQVTLTVTVPQLRGADLAGSGDMRIDQIRGANFDGSVAGSGNLLLGGVEVGSLKLSIAGSGDARTGKGSARTIDISVAGSGDADTRGTASPSASISVAGSGKVSAFATQIANVSVIGSGDVEIVGGARCAVTKAGHGRVHCS